jgi:hypothetical protein
VPGMRAVQITQFGGPEVLDVVDLSDPEPGPREELFVVSAAGDQHRGHTSELGIPGETGAPNCAGSQAPRARSSEAG